MQLPAEDHYSYDRQYLLTRIAILFGGRIAEEVFMHQMTTGASNDFERATQLARDMVMKYGMSDLMGPMVYAENENEVFLGRSVTQTRHMSEQTMQQVDAEVRRILDEQYAVARKLIEENQDKMHKMAKALLDWETIDAEQITDIMEGRDPKPPKNLAKKAKKAKEAGELSDAEEVTESEVREAPAENAPASAEGDKSDDTTVK
jgi:cell division protease FtsH